MKNKKTVFEEESEFSESSSDEELQEAFVSGKLKTGLNEVIEKTVRKFANNVNELKRLTKEMKLDLPWIETLDLVSGLAPLAPELVVQMQEQEDRRANELKNNAKLPQFKPSDDPVLNDFKREMMFHRQAQAAVLEGIPKLKQLGIATKRPDDFFAEMAKTDEHMQKIRKVLMKQQAQQQQKEKVRQLRIQKKENKIIQQQARLQKQQEKKEMLNQVKKVRKNLSNNLDFLDGKKPESRKKKKLPKKIAQKRNYKNEKYGFGGKKKGMKRNTKSSSADVFDKKSKFGAKKGKVKAIQNRPGKNRRKQMKNKAKK